MLAADANKTVPNRRLFARPNRAAPLRLLMESALVLGLAWLIAGLVWQVTGASLSPLPDTNQNNFGYTHTAAPVRVNKDVLTAFDPFNRDMPTASSTGAGEDAAPETRLNLKLAGIRRALTSADATEGGSAIIELPTGQQKSIRVGETVIDGVTLVAVRTTHVRIRREGVDESLYLEGLEPSHREGRPTLIQSARSVGVQKPGTALPQGQAVGEPQTGGVNGMDESESAVASRGASAQDSVSAADLEALMRGVSLTPRRDGNRITGWTIAALADTGAMARFGLQYGDVIRAVNDFELRTAERLSEIRDELSGASRLTLHFERGGERQTRTFQYSN